MAAETDAAADESSEKETTFGADATIVVDPDEIVAALRNGHEYPDRNGSEVLTVRPPFDGDCRAEHRFSQSGNYWPPETDPKPLDLSPMLFLSDEGRRRIRSIGYPTWGEVRSLLQGTESEDDEDIEQQNYDEWAELYEHGVRNALADGIDVNEYTDWAGEYVDVRYESIDE
jgi:hypothetical protein